MFWITAFLLSVIVAAAILLPTLRRPSPLAPRAAHDVEVYGAQLRELQADLERGTVPAGEAAGARAEIGRRLLRAASEADERGDASASRIVAPVAGTAAAILIVAGSLALYGGTGSPGQGDMPLEARLATDPAQADLPTLVAQIERRLQATPEDGRGWELIAPVYLQTGRADDAVRASDKAMRLLGPTAAREALRGEARVQAARGEVTNEAANAFRAAQRLDPKNPVARFYLAVDLMQERRYAEARAAWRLIVDDGPADAPWIASARQGLADAERQVVGAQTAPPPAAGASGPTEEQVTAAAELSAEDRSAMVAGMVSQLAERLKTAPNDPEGWKRLMRSYAVLGDMGRAREAHVQAQEVFAGETPERRSIDEFAAALGLDAEKAAP